MLFVSLSLWKLTTFDIHCSPVAGLSGWMYILFGISGSAFPATIQRELWNLYLQSSAATMSIKRMYLAFLSRPVHLTLNGGNIRLWRGATGQNEKSTRDKYTRNTTTTIWETGISRVGVDKVLKKAQRLLFECFNTSEKKTSDGVLSPSAFKGAHTDTAAIFV